MHPGGPGGLKIDHRIPDKGDLGWRQLHSLGNLEGPGGIGFSWQGVLLAENHGPGHPVKHPVHDLDGVMMWLIGADCEGKALLVQGFQHLPDARVKVCALYRGFLIGGKEVPVDLLHQFVGGGPSESASHEHTAAVTHKSLHSCSGVGWESVDGEGTVETVRNPGE